MQTRRGFMNGALMTGAGLGAALVPVRSRAQAKPDKLVFVGDNGMWHDCLVKEVAPAFEKSTGIRIDFTALPVDATAARLRSELTAGGTGIAAGPIPPSSAAVKYENTNRIIAFKLGGGAVPTPSVRAAEPFAEPPPSTGSAASINAGEIKFIEECSRCHTLGLSTTPDLRKLNPGLHAMFKDIVLHGALAPAGMEPFDDILSDKDVENIHAYLIDQSWIAYRAQQTAAHK